MSGLNVSDEELLNMAPPSVTEESAAAAPAVETTAAEPNTELTETEKAAAAVDTDNAGEGTPSTDQEVLDESRDTTTSKDTSKDGKVPATENGEHSAADKTNPEGTPASQAAKSQPDSESKKDPVPSGSSAESANATPDYEAFYKSMIGPLKANGKTIEVRNAEEARKLMSMGVNYTHKMQELAPQRKVLMMLQSHNLLDEDKLSFAIDLIANKNPEAIKKLIKEAGIDPLEIDVTSDSTYREGHHRVTDEEANFRTILEDVQSTQGGKETLQIINSQWDQASKEVLWKSPDILVLMNEQRANGIYDRIATEVDRRKALGAIPGNVPFLNAYKAVGEELANAGAFNDLVKVETSSAPATAVKPAPVATTTAKPKPAAVNGDKARAASATPSTPKTADVKPNLANLSDDDFMQKMASRH